MGDVRTIEIPYATVENSHGFSIDMGGSTIKITYRDTEDWKEAQKNPERKYAKLRMVTFDATDLQPALDFMEKNVKVSRENEKDIPIVYCTGTGCEKNKAEIEKRMKVSLKILEKDECFVQGLIHLSKTLPKDKFILDLPEKTMNKFKEDLAKMLPMIENMKKHTDMTIGEVNMAESEAIMTDKTKSLCENEAVFPCLIAILGSQFKYIKLEEDGQFSVVGSDPIGGRMFHGLGNILSGVESFTELMELAEKGVSKNVDSHTKDITVDTGEDIYSMFGDMDNLVYSFGKCVGSVPGQFKNEDVLRALLQTIILNSVGSAFCLGKEANCTRIFFCGSFVEYPFIREKITEVLYWKLQGEKMFHGAKKAKEMDFLNLGSHLGSIGAFIHTE